MLWLLAGVVAGLKPAEPYVLNRVWWLPTVTQPTAAKVDDTALKFSLGPVHFEDVVNVPTGFLERPNNSSFFLQVVGADLASRTSETGNIVSRRLQLRRRCAVV